MPHRVTIATLRTLERMAVDGVPLNEAARRTGEETYFVKYWASRRNVRFAPQQYRGTPAWLFPEMVRQAEAVLRATWEQIQCR
jgi:hypothetical protein